ncbi:hypothetical protein J4402_03070 [Candidatus Pacearchaeota archaeon]|nr:hypothetical protein [Candidatus Pacearchaeota archaeon]
MKKSRFAAAGLALALSGCGNSFPFEDSSIPGYIKSACWDAPDATIQLAIDEVREARDQGYSYSDIREWEIDSCLAVTGTDEPVLVNYCNECLGDIVDYYWYH